MTMIRSATGHDPVSLEVDHEDVDVEGLVDVTPASAGGPPAEKLEGTDATSPDARVEEVPRRLGLGCCGDD